MLNLAKSSQELLSNYHGCSVRLLKFTYENETDFCIITII